MSGTTTSAGSAASGYQNYILYRTVARTYQPASYIGPDGKTVTPAAITAQPVGYVVATQLLSSLSGITVPAGFAYAPDAAGTYPVGSTYTPPAAS
ncbi:MULTISPECIES: hypothetical protein [Komagataeibacter]|uniref:Uncharacterized protein n=1 Tax=Komagataeibacter saccharivorans TaxID=265959 RepID=A0A347WEW5_9PROT|nr:hypothetical protein [Komagataeibacter saccharivorans]MBL7237740.1 hypothetical protein [Novacetimonas hansenii]AXY23408.1 hypothetical protein CD178_02661 [Komagataeibacter saccharivorans]PYD50297.1 hypothetical protein CFR79_10165 [Komagataeibacter saccharivorans]QBL92693.1 hypothetical protein KSAC_04470 [Komagataeibacter saccharivorans]GBQ39943.1 hypothetical protein AA0614_1830 [Komagataeibacter saccharivorans NRIC 0614]